MVHDYVAHRLNQWAEWKLRRFDCGLGYPKQVAWFDNLPKGGFTQFTPDVKDECFEVEQCVLAVRATNQKMYDVIILSYCELNVTMEQKARRIGCCVNTFKSYMGIANRLVLGYLNDLACDIKLPQPAINLPKINKTLDMELTVSV